MTAKAQAMGGGQGLKGITLLQLAGKHQQPEHRKQFGIDQLRSLEALHCESGAGASDRREAEPRGAMPHPAGPKARLAHVMHP